MNLRKLYSNSIINKTYLTVHFYLIHGACGARVVRVWCACGARVVRVWCACGARVVRVWCACGARVVRVWCACGACGACGACVCVCVCDNTTLGQTTLRPW